MMENSFDNAHFAFVHKGTFGDIDQPKPEKYELTETHYGFVAETIVPVKNPPQAARITGTSEPWTRRKMRNAWFMPFCRTMDMEYPSGLRHVIFNSATPVDDGSIQLIQIHPLSQRPRGGLLDRGTHRLGPGDHRGGPRDSGID
jgi:phenylpropionate dioxygenase-like ring-hydroxylating dioxygenase large terminal subunit